MKNLYISFLITLLEFLFFLNSYFEIYKFESFFTKHFWLFISPVWLIIFLILGFYSFDFSWSQKRLNFIFLTLFIINTSLFLISIYYWDIIFIN